jgi:hypothetical protein
MLPRCWSGRDYNCIMDDERETMTEPGVVWNEYNARRQRFWTLTGTFLVLAALAVAFSNPFPMEQGLRTLLVICLWICVAACWFLGNVVWLQLLNWPCPRCGRSFVWSFLNTWPTDACKKCGLRVGSRIPAVRSQDGDGGAPSKETQRGGND